MPEPTSVSASSSNSLRHLPNWRSWADEAPAAEVGTHLRAAVVVAAVAAAVVVVVVALVVVVVAAAAIVVAAVVVDVVVVYQ